MAARTSKSGWRRGFVGAMASAVLVAGPLIAVGSAPASAEPTTEAAAPGDATAAPEMTADQALSIIASDYDTGAGGGQLSTLIHQVLKMRQAGYLPSNSNKQAIVDALDRRPNQAPLVKALESTLSFQMKQAARGQQQQQQPPTFGFGGTGGGVPNPNGGGGINIPLG